MTGVQTCALPISLGGKGGGGRADMAQAGGPEAAHAQGALAAVERGIAEKLQYAE